VGEKVEGNEARRSEFNSGILSIGSVEAINGRVSRGDRKRALWVCVQGESRNSRCGMDFTDMTHFPSFLLLG